MKRSCRFRILSQFEERYTEQIVPYSRITRDSAVVDAERGAEMAGSEEILAREGVEKSEIQEQEEGVG